MYEHLLPLKLVKIHLRVDDDYEDDAIQAYRDAAVERAQQFVQARFAADAATMSGGEVVWNDAIQAACLILAAWLFESREGGDADRSDKLPSGVYALLHPYRIGWGV